MLIKRRLKSSLSIRPQKLRSCDECKYKNLSGSNAAVALHMANHHALRLKTPVPFIACDDCEFVTRRADHIRWHTQLAHSVQRIKRLKTTLMHVCDDCSRIFWVANNCFKHWARLHKKVPLNICRKPQSKNWWCDQCQKGYFKPEQLESHLS